MTLIYLGCNSLDIVAAHGGGDQDRNAGRNDWSTCRSFAPSGGIKFNLAHWEPHSNRDPILMVGDGAQ